MKEKKKIKNTSTTRRNSKENAPVANYENLLKSKVSPWEVCQADWEGQRAGCKKSALPLRIATDRVPVAGSTY